MPRPSARPRTWLPKQMPKTGTPRPSRSAVSATARSAVAGSPGPLERNTPSAPVASTCSTVEVAGSTWVSMPRSAIRCGVIGLMPRSSAATVNRVSPAAATTYGSAVVTSPVRSAPSMRGLSLTLCHSRSGSSSTEDTHDAHRAALAQVPGQCPGVDAADAHDALAGQLVAQAALRPPRGRPPARLAHDVPADPDPAGLRVVVVDAGVADVRGGHHHDLAVVARVGEGLLVAGHAGGEDRLAERLAGGPEGLAAERPAVLQDEQGR